MVDAFQRPLTGSSRPPSHDQASDAVEKLGKELLCGRFGCGVGEGGMIRLGQSNVELRERLQIEGQPMSRHCDIVMALKGEFGHTIRCVDRPAEGTCLTYAFGLLDQFRPLCAEMEGFRLKPGSRLSSGSLTIGD